MNGKYKHEFLYAKILESQHTISSFAKIMGTTAEIFVGQLSGEISFSQTDLMRIRRLLYSEKTLCEMMKMIENAA